MSTPLRYGFRYWDGTQEIRLWQISGGGRIRLRNTGTGKSWWAKSSKGIRWEICQANAGHTFPDLETARELVALLSSNRDAT